MHDIKWIRDNPADFDPGLARRGLAAESAKLIALDEQRRAAIQKAEAAQARRNAASKEIGAAKKNKDEAAAARADGRGQCSEGAMPALEAEEKKLSEELDRRARRDPEPAAAEPEVPTARTSTTTSSTITSAPSATMRSRRSSTSNSAKSSASWTSRRPRNCQARASSC